ncbi:MAG: hypothetical protein LAP40_12850 [Acidobacteriia bacterium]|nr:hypothetical protein [Terriglobia bacterium]
MRLSLVVLLAGLFGGGVSQAQQVISAHAGVVHHIEGTVYVGAVKVAPKFGQFPDLRDGELLRTEDGKAEVLLTPGAFLRVAANSSVRMLSRDLSDARFEVLSGSVMVECDELLKDNSLTLVYGSRNIQLEKDGLYRLDTDPARFQVFDGKAVVQSGTERLTLKRGKQTDLDGVLVASKFNTKLVDPFYVWNSQRAGYLASANVSAAQSLRYGGTSWTSSGWMWNPWFNAYTFVPGNGIGYSPFGWNLWSPAWVVYAPVYGYGGYGGYGRPVTNGNPGSVTAGNNGRQSVGNGGSSNPPVSRGSSPPSAARPNFGGGFGGGSSSGGFSGGGISSGSSSGGVRSGGAPHSR